MDITFTCPHCGEVTLIDESFVGQAGECRTCGEKILVPPVVASSQRSHELATPVRSSRGFGGWLLTTCCALAVLFVLALCLVNPLMHSRSVAQRMQSGNNLKLIALAMSNYHDTYRQLPRAYWLTKEGERTLSWRVAISPFLSELMILKEYDSNLAWDAPSNQKLAKRERYVFRQPGANQRSEGETGYMVITGPGTLFEEGKDISFADCKDGLANTILAVEVRDSGVNWLQPVDLDIRNMIFQINGGAFGISSPWKDGAQVVMADGRLVFLTNKTLESTLRAMITRASGEKISVP